MGYWSGRAHGEAFRLFGPRHLGALAATGLGIAATLALGRAQDEPGRRRTRAVLVAGLWGQEAVYHGWKAWHGQWNLKEMLPLHLCSVLVWVGGANLLRPTRSGDDLAWYWGMAGAPQALLTPDLAEFGARHFRFHQFFASHGLVLVVPLWQVVVEGRRPTAAGGVRAWSLLLAHAGVAHLVNRRVGSNYMFVTRKPDTASILDTMPPWPGYVPVLVALAAAWFAASYAPFAVADAVRADRPRRRPLSTSSAARSARR
ncbi:MAG: TIGR02206 family membrane protein [Propionibacteriaceae bacterium]|nr:TIGR02206 family membrane protein [Propionibacteriaceae bacterium]